MRLGDLESDVPIAWWDLERILQGILDGSHQRHFLLQLILSTHLDHDTWHVLPFGSAEKIRRRLPQVGEAQRLAKICRIAAALDQHRVLEPRAIRAEDVLLLVPHVDHSIGRRSQRLREHPIPHWGGLSVPHVHGGQHNVHPIPERKNVTLDKRLRHPVGDVRQDPDPTPPLLERRQGSDGVRIKNGLLLEIGEEPIRNRLPPRGVHGKGLANLRKDPFRGIFHLPRMQPRVVPRQDLRSHAEARVTRGNARRLESAGQRLRIMKAPIQRHTLVTQEGIPKIKGDGV